MKLFLIFTLFLFFYTTTLAQANSYVFSGKNIENTLFITQRLTPLAISSNKIKTITENQINSKTIFSYNKNGNIIKTESFEKDKIVSSTIIKYDSNNHISSFQAFQKRKKIIYNSYSKYNNDGLLLSYTDYYFNNKGEIIDSSSFFCDSISNQFYFLKSSFDDNQYKLNFQNRILVVKSKHAIDSIAISCNKDTLIKTYWFSNEFSRKLYSNRFIKGKVETYLNNLLVDEKIYHNRFYSKNPQQHRTYQYDEQNRLSTVILDDYIKDKIIYLYHHHGFLYQKIKRLSEMEFQVTKYTYSYY